MWFAEPYLELIHTYHLLHTGSYLYDDIMWSKVASRRFLYDNFSCCAADNNNKELCNGVIHQEFSVLKIPAYH